MNYIMSVSTKMQLKKRQIEKQIQILKNSIPEEKFVIRQEKVLYEK